MSSLSSSALSSPVNFARPPRPLAGSGWQARLRLFTLGALLVFSFIPLPIYINISQIFLCALCLVALGCYLVRFDAELLAALLLIALVALSQATGIAHTTIEDKNYLTPLLFLTSMLIAPSMLLLVRSYPPEFLSRLMPRFVKWTLVFLVIECVTRLIFSPRMSISMGANATDRFYLYKFSLFFFDSNFAGIEILCLLSLMLAFRDVMGRNQWWLAYLLLLATLSRASIAAAICQLAVCKLWRWRRWTLIGLLAAQALVVLKLFIGYVTQGNEATQAINGSLSTKFYILALMTSIYEHADTTSKLFGIGVGNLSNMAGIFAHNIVATFVLEIGILGSLLFAVYVWLLCRRSPAAIYLLILPMIINGFSLVSTSMPYFFAALGVLGAFSGPARDGSRVIGRESCAAAKG